eukprot:COSAG01_NODE_82_length_27810_cov_36.968352_23_plen_38_part_00
MAVQLGLTRYAWHYMYLLDLVPRLTLSSFCVICQVNQ